MTCRFSCLLSFLFSGAALADPGRARLALQSTLVDTQVVSDEFLRVAPASTVSLGQRGGGLQAGWLLSPRWELGLSGSWAWSSDATVRPRSERQATRTGTTRLGPYLALHVPDGPRWSAWAEGGVEMVLLRGRTLAPGASELDPLPRRSVGYDLVGGLGARRFLLPRTSLELAGRWNLGSHWGRLEGSETVSPYGTIEARLLGGLSLWFGADRD